MRLTFCVACGERDRDLLEHHHLLPLAEGGSDTEANLITLCLTCHGTVHGEIRRPSRQLQRERARASAALRKMRGSGKLALPPRVPKARVDGSNAKRRIKAEQFHAFMKLIEFLRRHRRDSLRKLCLALNANGVLTSRGKQWTAPVLHNKLRAIEHFFARHPDLVDLKKATKRQLLCPQRVAALASGSANQVTTPSTQIT